MANNNNTNNIVNLNLIQSLFKFNKLGNGETSQGLLRHLVHKITNNNKNFPHNDMYKKILKRVQGDSVTRHPEGNSPKDLQTQNHVITRKNIEQEMQKSTQSDVVIPNELGNGETCQGLLRRFVHKNTNNNEISPHNDMIIKTVTNLFPYFPVSFSTKKKFAFTLAEVLITLGIIGIVAAITIPGLISNKQKMEIETKLREDYSIIQQSMKMSENDGLTIDPYMPEPVQEIQKWFDTFLAPYMKYSNACVEKKGCWQSDGPTKNLAGEIAYCSRTGIGVGYGILTMRLINGTNLNFDSYSKEDAKRYLGLITTNKVLAIFIDVNGDRKPNIIGKDIFIAILTEDGIVPAGISESNEKVDENCSSNSTDINAGYYCLLKVKNNGWEIPNDVWGKKI